MRPDRIGIWKCCNKRRFNLQDSKKLFTHKLLFPSRNFYQVMDLDVLSLDLYCESRDNTSRLVRSRLIVRNMSIASLNLLLNLSSSLVRIAEEDKVWPDFR